MTSPSAKAVIFIFSTATVLVLLLLGFILLIVVLYREKQQRFAVQMKNLREEAEKELLRTQLEMQEQTFQYISQEIHDNVGQFISLAKLQLNTLDFSDPESSSEKAAHSVSLLTKAMDDLRDLSRSLSSDMVRRHGLVAALQLQASQLRKLGFASVSYEVDGDSKFLEEQKEIFILRIVQEAANNIIRHAEAREVSIRVGYSPNRLVVAVRDNGKGFDLNAVREKQSSGICNMTRRAHMIGGKLEIDSKPGEGTLVRFFLPT